MRPDSTCPYCGAPVRVADGGNRGIYLDPSPDPDGDIEVLSYSGGMPIVAPHGSRRKGLTYNAHVHQTGDTDAATAHSFRPNPPD